MPNKNMIRETMQSVHASDDLYERVMERATHPSRRRRRGAAMPLAAVAGLVVAATVAAGGSAYAIMNIQPGAPLLDRIWGDNGLGDRSEWSIEGNSGQTYSFNQTYSTLDPAQLGDEFINAEQEVGMTVEANGYTLLVESMMIDANGCGAVTMVLSNPDGISYSPQYGGPGELVLNGDEDAGLDAIQMKTGATSFGFANTTLMYNVETAEETRMELVMYFDLMEWGDTNALKGGVSWSLVWSGPQGTEEASTDAFYPDRVIGALDLHDGDAHVSVTPFSLRIPLAGFEDTDLNLSVIVIELVDGTEVVVRDSDRGAENHYINSYSADSSSIAYTFTQMVDTSKVKAVRLEGERVAEDGKTFEEVEYRLTVE